MSGSLGADIADAAREAFVHAMSRASIVAALVAALGAVHRLALPAGPRGRATCATGDAQAARSAAGAWSCLFHPEALDHVMKGQEALTGQVEAVVGLQLAVDDVDVDALLEIQELEDRQGVPFAVDELR